MPWQSRIEIFARIRIESQSLLQWILCKWCSRGETVQQWVAIGIQISRWCAHVIERACELVPWIHPGKISFGILRELLAVDCGNIEFSELRKLPGAFDQLLPH